MKQYGKILIQLIIFLFGIFSVISCDNNKDGLSGGGTTQNNLDTMDVPNPDAEDTSNEDTEEDTYSVWTDPCVECAWYFCGNLESIWQKQICLDKCEDPPTVVYEGPCEEHLECNPAQLVLEANIPCTTEDGFPGVKDKLCNKGQIQYTDCKTECFEEICDGLDNDCDDEIDEGVTNACGECGEVPQEICDYIDNDCDGVIDNGVANACGDCGKVPEEVCNGIDDNCDGETDEGQLNACGECGPVDEEVCDGLDNDCDGLVDENLVDSCSTDCETNLQYCVAGNWICTAKQPSEEICNGLDDDCDGSIDEDLDCLCTVQDVGVLMPCQEGPLVCGAGYKTCECVDPDCTELKLTDCLAVCHWFPQSVPEDSICDKYLGEIKPEECNNHDDNCNELIDENLFSMCYSGPAETMFVGICLPGEMVCLNGSWGNYDDNGTFIDKLCLDEVTPEPEDVCNGVDSNCDGVIDEDKELEPTDILFIVDLSSSMTEEINAVTTALNLFAAYYSDSEVIRWGLVFTASGFYPPTGGHSERIVLQTNLVDFQTFMSSFQSSGIVLNGGHEQNYDAIYLAIHNLVSAVNLPFELSEFEWIESNWTPISDSIPTIEEWEIDWRDDAKHVIIVFSDEKGQSYLQPEITESILVNMINAADELSVYAFTSSYLATSLASDNYKAITAAGVGGELYKLTMSAVEMYVKLLEILDETACGNKEGE